MKQHRSDPGIGIAVTAYTGPPRDVPHASGGKSPQSHQEVGGKLLGIAKMIVITAQSEKVRIPLSSPQQRRYVMAHLMSKGRRHGNRMMRGVDADQGTREAHFSAQVESEKVHIAAFRKPGQAEIHSYRRPALEEESRRTSSDGIAVEARPHHPASLLHQVQDARTAEQSAKRSLVVLLCYAFHFDCHRPVSCR